MPIKLNGTTIFDESDYATKEYVSSAIGALNMLKIMDWSNVQEASVTRNTPFTAPADGYICFSLLASNGYYCAINDKALGWRGGSSSSYQYYGYVSTGVPISVKQGDIITTINVDAGNTVYAALYFIPFKS